MALGRFFAMWAMMAVAMSLNGIGRELLLRRLLAERSASVISALLGILWIGLITRWGFQPLTSRTPRASELWTLSVALIVLTVLFETILGRVVDHKSWTQILDHYALWRGELWPIVLTWLAVTPFVWGRGWLPT